MFLWENFVVTVLCMFQHIFVNGLLQPITYPIFVCGHIYVFVGLLHLPRCSGVYLCVTLAK